MTCQETSTTIILLEAGKQHLTGATAHSLLVVGICHREWGIWALVDGKWDRLTVAPAHRGSGTLGSQMTGNLGLPEDVDCPGDEIRPEDVIQEDATETLQMIGIRDDRTGGNLAFQEGEGVVAQEVGTCRLTEILVHLEDLDLVVQVIQKTLTWILEEATEWGHTWVQTEGVCQEEALTENLEKKQVSQKKQWTS